MAREKKVQLIDELSELLLKCEIGILTDYRGLSTAEITDLRRQLRAADIGYKIVKNSLARLASVKAGRSELADSFEGPIAIAFGYGDVSESTKVLANYIRTAKSNLDIKSGFLSDRLLTSKDVATLATLPSRDVLLAKVIGGMQSPIVSFMSLLTAPVRGVLGLLQARIEQLEGESNVGK